MIHLIWSILNLLLLVYFLYLIIGFIAKGKKVFKTRFKIISIAIMSIGVVQLISASITEKNTNKITIVKDYKSKHNTKLEQVVLKDNLTFNIEMTVEYVLDQEKYIPIESSTYLTGLISGYTWEFESFITENDESNVKPEYIVHGTLKWNILGIPVYSESKTILTNSDL